MQKKIMVFYPPSKLYQRGEDRSQGNVEDSSATSMRAPNDLGYASSTLKKDGNLRGCIGSPVAHRTLALDVIQNAFNAAFNDPRFSPIKSDDLENLDISISLLSQAKKMQFSNETDFLSQLRPGVDGVIIEDLGRQSLFLPSVWKQLPDAKNFMQRLKLKAGLNRNHWSATFKAKQFIAEDIAMSELFE